MVASLAVHKKIIPTPFMNPSHHVPACLFNKKNSNPWHHQEYSDPIIPNIKTAASPVPEYLEQESITSEDTTSPPYDILLDNVIIV